MSKNNSRQIILACNEQGNFQEYIPKEVGHAGNGKRHLAITVLIYNDKGEVLLQQRKHKVFDNIWDITGATHPLHREDNTDENFTEATLRCIKREYNIDPLPLQNLGSFNYDAQYGDLCENEHCAMMLGEYNGPLKLNNEVGYSYKWMDKNEFLADIRKNPQKYSAWAKKGVEILKKKGFFI
ncbi:NUDIX domain-containing protein [Candidatus Microgenomates bacterium]|nr:NUDIX domain-containing protein [Candidatus Microgenomates bacterium]